MQDLESALHHALRQEIATCKNIDGEKLDGLKTFIRVVAKVCCDNLVYEFCFVLSIIVDAKLLCNFNKHMKMVLFECSAVTDFLCAM